MDEIVQFLNGEGDWNTNKNLKSILRIKVVDMLNALGVEPAGGAPLTDYSAAADALGPIQAMRSRSDPTPTNAAERKAIAALKGLFATIEDDAAYAKLLSNYESKKAGN